jgi:hypothetical protein
MIQKIITLIVKSNSCVSLLLNLYDTAVFLYQVWSPIELVLIILIGLWIPVIRFSTFLHNTFGTRLPVWLTPKRSKWILLTTYWFGISAVVSDVIAKWIGGYDPLKLFALIAVYLFFAIIDFVETRHMINKLNDK